MIYELREYVSHTTAEQQVHDRFRDVTLPLFGKHGLEVVGFWSDHDDPRRIVYLLCFEDLDAKARAWESFQHDPDWKKAKAASEADGPIVASMSSRILQPVPYWPDQASGTPS